MRTNQWLWTSVALLAGCVGPGGALLEVTTSAIAVAGGATWHGSSVLDLGDTSEETCWLSGVSGSLVGSPGYYYNNGSTADHAIANVYPKNGRWHINVEAGVGAGVQARAVCINMPYPGSDNEFTWSDNLALQGIDANPNRHCFLRKVWGSSLTGASLGGVVTNLTIKKRNGQFDMNDSFVENIGGDYMFGGATAICIDFPETAQWNYTFVGPTNSTNTASETKFLRDFYPDGPKVPISDVVCGLTGIKGRWVSSPNVLGYDDGVLLTNDASVSSFWKVTSTNGRSADVECIR